MVEEPVLLHPSAVQLRGGLCWRPWVGDFKQRISRFDSSSCVRRTSVCSFTLLLESCLGVGVHCRSECSFPA